MSRPPGDNDAFVDATVQAHAGKSLERRFSVSQLPRLSEAGIAEPGGIRISLRLSLFEGRVALDGHLGGCVSMICQRCMQPVEVELEDEFRLLIVDDEAQIEGGELGGYEAVVADPAHLDLRWLAEEQSLLSVPLVPKHAGETCPNAASSGGADEADQQTTQRPFADLKKMLRKS